MLTSTLLSVDKCDDILYLLVVWSQKSPQRWSALNRRSSAEFKDDPLFQWKTIGMFNGVLIAAAAGRCKLIFSWMEENKEREAINSATNVRHNYFIITYQHLLLAPSLDHWVHVVELHLLLLLWYADVCCVSSYVPLSFWLNHVVQIVHGRASNWIVISLRMYLYFRTRSKINREKKKRDR